MPCNSEHMEPTVKERQRREAAQHLVHLSDTLGIPVYLGTREAAKDIYGGNAKDAEKRMADLCKILRGLSDEDMNKAVYDGRNPKARKLADWWEEHQREDWKRREIEAKEAKSFTTCLDLAKRYLEAGYSVGDAAERVAAITGKYFDFEDGTHVLTFDDGVIILSSMDGLTAYKGERV